MSAKPTPGPYTITQLECLKGESSFVVKSENGRAIATFWGPHFAGNPSTAEAEANARAWVEGRESAEKLDRIRAVLSEMPDAPLRAIAHIIDKAKPIHTNDRHVRELLKFALERLDRIRAIMRQQNVKRSVMWNQIAEELDDD